MVLFRMGRRQKQLTQHGQRADTKVRQKLPTAEKIEMAAVTQQTKKAGPATGLNLLVPQLLASLSRHLLEAVSVARMMKTIPASIHAQVGQQEQLRFLQAAVRSSP